MYIPNIIIVKNVFIQQNIRLSDFWRISNSVDKTYGEYQTFLIFFVGKSTEYSFGLYKRVDV